MILFLIIIIVLLFGALGLCIFLLYRLNKLSNRYEQYFLDLNETISSYRKFLDDLMGMNILYYDETIYELVEKTKQLKLEVTEILENFEDLTEYIYPEKTEEEKKEEFDAEPKHVFPLLRGKPRIK